MTIHQDNVSEESLLFTLGVCVYSCCRQQGCRGLTVCVYVLVSVCLRCLCLLSVTAWDWVAFFTCVDMSGAGGIQVVVNTVGLYVNAASSLNAVTIYDNSGSSTPLLQTHNRVLFDNTHTVVDVHNLSPDITSTSATGPLQYSTATGTTGYYAMSAGGTFANGDAGAGSVASLSADGTYTLLHMLRSSEPLSLPGKQHMQAVADDVSVLLLVCCSFLLLLTL